VLCVFGNQICSLLQYTIHESLEDESLKRKAHKRILVIWQCSKV